MKRHGVCGEGTVGGSRCFAADVALSYVCTACSVGQHGACMAGDLCQCAQSAHQLPVGFEIQA